MFTLGFLAPPGLCCLYGYHSQHKKHCYSQLAIKSQFCPWLTLNYIPIPEPIIMSKWLEYTEWQDLDHVLISGNWKLRLRVERTVSPKGK